MVKKIASVVFLSIGDFFLMALLMPLLLMILADRGLALSYFLFNATLGSVLIVVGIALWGWSRWRIVLGVIFTIAGSTLALTTLGMFISVHLAMLSSEWESLSKGISNSDVSTLIVSTAFFGILLLTIGIPLIINQKRWDKKGIL